MPCTRRESALAGKWAVLLLASLLAAGVSSAHARRRPKPTAEDIAFNKHIQRVTRFPCSTPQPRALSSSDIIQEGDVPVSTSEMIFPVMTVLHRCDAGSGCCMQGSGLLCGPERETEVQLDFKLVDGTTKKARHVVVTAHNHTKCACMENFPK